MMNVPPPRDIDGLERVDRDPCPCCGVRGDIGCNCKIPPEKVVYSIGNLAAAVLKRLTVESND